jgi:enoyl-CoA hydratase/carnithine racemase
MNNTDVRYAMEGRAFCSGYDLVEFAKTTGEQPGSQLGGDDSNAWDPMTDFYGMKRNTEHLMSLWRSYKPTIARIHGPAVAHAHHPPDPRQTYSVLQLGLSSSGHQA